MCEYPVLAPVSRSYPRVRGRLLTCYSPVRRSSTPERAFPLDLHVLSTPPAFVLSQDQTLQQKPLKKNPGKNRRKTAPKPTNTTGQMPTGTTKTIGTGITNTLLSSQRTTTPCEAFPPYPARFVASNPVRPGSARTPSCATQSAQRVASSRAVKGDRQAVR